MANELDMAKAKRTYETVCRILDKMDLKYNRHDDDLIVTLGHKGKDLKHDLLIRVNAEKTALTIIEQLPFDIDSDHALDICVAICALNKNLLCGRFDYTFDKKLFFAMSQFCDGIEIPEELVKRMLMSHAATVEEYDDKLFSLNKGHIKLTDFLTELEKED